MRLFRVLSLGVLLASGFSLAARADILSYTVVFTSVNSGPGGSGTFSVDTTTGLLTSADFTVFSTEFTLADAFGAPPTYDNSGLLYQGIILVSGAIPVGLDIGTNVTMDAPGADYALAIFPSTVVDEGSVSITQTSATPEPSSFALLGTGVVGTVGMVRRRNRRA